MIDSQYSREVRKIIKCIQNLLFLAGWLGVSMIGYSQTYSYSGPINGSFEMLLSDDNGPFSGHNPNPGIVGAVCQFSTLTDTVYLDPIAHTIRQTGFIGVSPVNASGVVDDIRQVGGISVPATLVLNLAVDGGGIAFDTGPLHYFNTPNGTDYSFGPTPTFPVLFDGSYSWSTGGQTYSDSFKYQLEFGLTVFSHFSFPDPATLNLTKPFSTGALGEIVARTNSANGLALDLITGGSDHASLASWTGSITATTVPEPGCISLFCFGSATLVLSPRFRT